MADDDGSELVLAVFDWVPEVDRALGVSH